MTSSTSNGIDFDGTRTFESSNSNQQENSQKSF